jgi:dihydropteroate synthase
MPSPSFQRATRWKLRTRTLELPRMPLLMGIVNVTPDSFSDGGKFLDTDAAVSHALQLVADGADILDVGGESTRPNAVDVSVDVELARVLPVIERLVPQVSVPISIDTRKAAVARAAIAAGAEIINDVSGLTHDPEIVEVAVATCAGVCVMHMQGTPQTMQAQPTYGDVVREVHDYLLSRRDALIAAGVEPTRICLDPGIGFGKTFEHNLALLQNAGQFHGLGCPVLVGHSRKRFLASILGDENVDRTAATTGVALALSTQGVQVLRVHDVCPIREALLAFRAAGGMA